MACDICGDNDKPITDLRDGYKSTLVKQVCRECEKDLNKVLSRMHDSLLTGMKKMLKNYMLRRRTKLFKVK